MRVAVFRLNGNDGVGRDGREVLRIRRDDRESVGLSGLSKTTWAIDPAMSGIGAIDTKTLLFVTGFFSVCERTARFTEVGRVGLSE